MMTLFVDTDFLSPYAMSAFVALTEKQVPFTLRTVNLSAGEQQQAPYAEMSRTQRVPTLIHDQFSLSESSAISEYLQDTQLGLPLYPSNHHDKAIARQIQAWLRSDLTAIRAERPSEAVFRQQRFAPLSAAAQQATNKLVTAASAWLKPEQQHLFSDWCIADTDLAMMIQRLAMHGDAIPDTLVAYAEQQWQRPSVQQWLSLSHANKNH